MTTPPELIRLWSDFIGPYEERVKECGTRIAAIAERLGAKRILDTAAGLGFDARHLHADANELDGGFRAECKQVLEDMDVRVTALDWRELDRLTNSYDLELCIGNNLTYLHERHDQLEALRKMRIILNMPGALLIDQRNYDAMLRQAQEDPSFTARPLKNEQTYKGNLVTVTPRVVTPENIRLHYQHAKEPIEESLNLYPFGFHEFRKLLRTAGFSHVDSMENWRPIEEPESYDPLAADENAFFQHLAYK